MSNLTTLIRNDLNLGHYAAAASRAVTLVKNGLISAAEAADALGFTPAIEGLDKGNTLHRLINFYPRSKEGRDAKKTLAARKEAVMAIHAEQVRAA